MDINFDKYVAVALKDIEINRDIISKFSIDILIKTRNEIIIFLDSSKVYLLFNKKWRKENKIFNNAEHFIIKSDEEMFTKENMDYDISLQKKFFSFFPSCEASISDVSASEREILNNISIMDTGARVKKMHLNLENIKKFVDYKKITKEAADKIASTLTELSFIERLEMIKYLDKIRNHKTITFPKPLGSKAMQNIVSSTIYTIVDILSKEKDDKDVFDSNIHFIDTNVIAHSNRVFVNFVEFLYYYNHGFNNKALGSKIRIEFQVKFLNYYKKIFAQFSPKRVNINSIEEILKIGIRALSFREIREYSIAAFWHDLVKVDNIDYLESDKSNNYKKAKAHVFNGYYLSKYTGKNSKLNSIMTSALHHEYYGHGYGIFSKMYKNKKLIDPNFDIPYIMTYDAKDMETLSSIAFFPAKVLEIIDVYDILLYPSKGIDRNPMSPKEAILYIRQFMIENTLKLDPIIFNLFISFLRDVKSETSDLAEI